MDTLEIRIPKLSLIKDEMKAFVELRDYLSALGNIYYRKQQLNEGDLTTNLWREMRKDKTKLYTCIDKYKEHIDHMKECQKAVWITRAKVFKYSSMVDAAQMSLHYYKDDKQEYKERVSAIEGLKKDLSDRLQRHSKNIYNYDLALSKEAALRNMIVKLSSTLKDLIVDKLNAKINMVVDHSSGNDKSEFPVELVSNCIYDLICHTLVIDEPPSDITSLGFKQHVQQPELTRNLFNRETTRKVNLKNQLNKTSTKNDSGEINQLIIELNKVNASCGEVDIKVQVEEIIAECPTEKAAVKQRKGPFNSLKKRLTRKRKS